MGDLTGLAAQSYGLGVFLAIGLFGGAHCLGMCGPLVATYATRMRAGTPAASESGAGRPRRVRWRDVRQHGLFNLGRTASYATVGAILGAVGALVFDAAALLAVGDLVRAVTGVTVGAFVLLVGARYLLGETGSSHDALLGTGALFERASGVLVERVDAWVRGPRIVALGAVHAFLPCPLLYPAYLYALARGSPVEGALALGALGLGTFPTMFAVGTLSGGLSAAARARVHRLLGALFLLLGFVALTHGLGLFGLPVPRIPLPVYRPLG